MAKRHLDNIKRNLQTAKEYIREAKENANRAGDGAGSSKISQLEEHTEKVQKNFDKDM